MSDYSPTFQHLGKTYVNPLSMELRIVLGYFWRLYNDCQAALRAGQSWEHWGKAAAEILVDVHNICHDLFSPASSYSHIHIHSEYGCDSEAFPSWQWGFEAGEEHAKETVGDWYEPEPLYSV